MSVTPATSGKRDRDSPGVTSPLSKQSKMGDNSASKDGDRIDKMMELLESLKKGQESLQKTFDSKLERLRNDVLAKIDDKMRSVKVDMNLQLAGLERKIGDLESEMNSLRSDPGFVDTSVNNCERTVIATNIPVRHDRPLIDTSKALISALGEDISRRSRITDVKRCPDRGTGKTPLLKIAFETVEQKVDVLRAKESLKNTREFKNVYLRSSKNHTERILELNAKTLLSQLPNGNQYRVTANGRIVKKDNRNGTPNASDPIETDDSR